MPLTIAESTITHVAFRVDSTVFFLSVNCNLVCLNFFTSDSSEFRIGRREEVFSRVYHQSSRRLSIEGVLVLDNVGETVRN